MERLMIRRSVYLYISYKNKEEHFKKFIYDFEAIYDFKAVCPIVFTNKNCFHIYLH